MRDVILALSLANLCFLWTWRHLVFASANERFLDPRFGWRDLLGALLDVWILAAVFLLVFAAARRAQRVFLRWSLWLAPFLLLLVQFRVSLSTLAAPYFETYGRGVVLTVAGLLATVGIVLLWMLRHRMVAVRDFALVLAAMFTLLTFLRAGWGVAGDMLNDAAPLPRRTAAAATSGAGKKVVWLLFDELDYRLAFEERPAGVRMPEFDRLRAQSVFLQNALPAGQRTMVAVPSMLTGLPVRQTRPIGETEMELELSDGRREALSRLPSLFSRLAAAGRSSAVVGWYFPYCSVYGPYLSSCHWEPMQTPRPQPTLGKAMARHFVQLLPWFRRISAHREYDGLVHSGLQTLGDSPADLILVHLSVPHAPPLYDKEAGTGNLFILRRDWYEDNLRLADITLGLLRRKMEESGRWDESTVLVSSDHQYRESAKYDGKSDPRIPLLVKLPRQQTATTHAAEFRGEKMFGLVSALFEDGVETPEQLAEWLAREQTAADAKE